MIINMFNQLVKLS